MAFRSTLPAADRAAIKFAAQRSAEDARKGSDDDDQSGSDVDLDQLGAHEQNALGNQINPKGRQVSQDKRYVAKESPAIQGESFAQLKQHCLKTGILNDTNERVVCAYAGFDDLADCRRWMTTPPFLLALDAFISSGAPKRFAEAIKVYQMDRRLWTDKDIAWASGKWPVTLKEKQATHDLDSQLYATYMLAFLIHWLLKESDRYASLSREEQQKEYEAVGGKLHRKVRLPDWEVVFRDGFKTPRWNHENDKTLYAEKCCRAFGLLRVGWHRINKLSLETKARAGAVATAKSVHGQDTTSVKWDVLLNDPTKFASCPVGERYKPTFMQSKKHDYSFPAPKSGDHQERDPPSKSDPREIFWKLATLRQHGTILGIRRKQEEEFEELREEHDGFSGLHDFPVVAMRDPRDFDNDKEFRDYVRLDFDLESRKKSLFMIGMTRPGTGDDDDEVLDIVWHKKRAPKYSWKKFQDFIQHEPKPVHLQLIIQFPHPDDWEPEREFSGALHRQSGGVADSSAPGVAWT